MDVRAEQLTANGSARLQRCHSGGGLADATAPLALHKRTWKYRRLHLIFLLAVFNASQSQHCGRVLLGRTFHDLVAGEYGSAWDKPDCISMFLFDILLRKCW